MTVTVAADASVRPGQYSVVIGGATVYGPIPPVTMTITVTGTTGTTTP
jgi:hypothetical protein